MDGNKNNSRKQLMLGFKARMSLEKTWRDSLADFLTRSFGTLPFLGIHVVVFVSWILINTKVWPILPPFDPFPFTFLTLVVSLEAIFLSIVVLMSENRQNEIADMREELDFEINVRAEQEITRILKLLDEIHDHLGLGSEDDDELKQMKENIDIKKLGDELRDGKYK